MTHLRAFLRRFPYIAVACLIVGAATSGLAAIACVLSRNLFDPVTFGRHAADSLSDPGVAAYAANVITSRIVHRKPDLVAFQPLLLSMTETLVASKVFRSVVERAAQRAHEAAFGEGSQRVLLALPDLNVLVHEALRNASPGLAAKIPKNIDSTVARLAEGKAASLLLNLARAGKRLRRGWPVLFAVAFVLCTLAIWLAHDRQRAMVHAGFCLVGAGLVLVAVVALNPLAGIWIRDVKELGLVRGLWRTYLGDLTGWGFLLIGFGILIASGASSLLERFHPFEKLSQYTRAVATTPGTQTGRFVWGVTFFLVGCFISYYPALMLSCVGVVIGISMAYAGLRQLFRVFLETLDTVEKPMSAPRHSVHRAAAVCLLTLLLSGAWFVWRSPAAVPVRGAPAILACNGFPQLCDRRIDQVVFAGAHNAMSSQDVPGWMFPHHEAGIRQMLQDGIRALLVDVHYGFAGGARIKTDMRTQPNADTIKGAIGDEGYAAAMRIRDRLVGVDESRRGLYFCHGFCELGAYPVLPALRDMRDFLVTHPDEIVIIIVEDTVSPQDLASEFDKAGLANLIYMESPIPQWPTLRQLIERDRRVLVFTESGRPGVTWLRPAFESFGETPYTFHKVEEFSCRANRGGEGGQLLQINHWIDTTPTPRPSNATIVNAYSFLLARAEQCASERRHLPNLIAVDFYKTGDLFNVVNKLNGVADPPDTLSEPASKPSDQLKH
jgi:hypothetical protein